MGCWGLVLGQDRFLLMEFLFIDKWGNYFAKLNKTKNTTTLNIAQLFKSLFYYFSGLQWQRITCKLYMLHMSKNSKQNFKNWNSINEIFLFRFMVSYATFNNISVIMSRFSVFKFSDYCLLQIYRDWISYIYIHVLTKEMRIKHLQFVIYFWYHIKFAFF